MHLPTVFFFQHQPWRLEWLWRDQHKGAEKRWRQGGSSDGVVRPWDTVLYPLANVTIEVEGSNFPITSAVSTGLPVSVLLGTDVPQLGGTTPFQSINCASIEAMDHALVSNRAQRKTAGERRKGVERKRATVCSTGQAIVTGTKQHSGTPVQWGRKGVVRYKVQEGKSQTGNA